MLDATDALNVALARVAELEIKLDNLIVQVEKVKHLKAGLKIVEDRVVELKAQRDTGRDRIEELEGMLEKAQDHLATAHARITDLETERDNIVRHTREYEDLAFPTKAPK